MSRDIEVMFRKEGKREGGAAHPLAALRGAAGSPPVGWKENAILTICLMPTTTSANSVFLEGNLGT